MTAFLRRATSGLAMWLGWDSATSRGFGLGRPGWAWPTWSLLTPVVPAVARVTPSSPGRGYVAASRACVR